MKRSNPNTHQHELIPTTPEEALRLYLDDLEVDGAAQSTQYAHKSRLGHFTRWCNQVTEITNLNNLTGRDIQRYRAWRRQDGDLNKVTVKTQMDTLRVFIRWCESIDAVRPDLHVTVRSPDLDDGENQRNETLPEERAEQILEYLSRYHYASAPHTVLEVMWTTCARVGAIHALDLSDYDPKKRYLHFVHRPDTDTPLKNKEDGERYATLNKQACRTLDDYIENNRHNVRDEHGRKPLFTSSQGRRHTTNLRAFVYRWTRPCAIGQECPENLNPETCEAADDQRAYKCPESVAPHAIRRGAITRWLREEVPPEVVGDRANVSKRVMDMHYNQMTEEERAEQRRDWFED